MTSKLYQNDLRCQGHHGPLWVNRIASTASKASPNVRYAFNGDRICASQRTDTMCHNRT